MLLAMEHVRGLIEIYLQKCIWLMHQSKVTVRPLVTSIGSISLKSIIGIHEQHRRHNHYEQQVSSALQHHRTRTQTIESGNQLT